ncbi:hypothetical protein P7C73_g1838, partial [Tremellales sp. Uapishka_1]
MPKHAVTYKHLIASTATPQLPTPPPERTVNDLLAQSRSSRPGAQASPSGVRIWQPDPSAIAVDDQGIHAAEVLRRTQVARRIASRGVAGPAPPPSWEPPVAAAPPAPREAETSHPRANDPVTRQDLLDAADLFQHPLLTTEPLRRETGADRLIEYCLTTLLRYLEDSTIAYISDEDGSELSTGEFLKQNLAFLQPHLKSQLLSLSSLEIDPSRRLSDKSIKLLLASPSAPVSEDDDDWEFPTSSIQHLALTLHPSPQKILRQIPTFDSLSLTSLNLGYSTIPNLGNLIVYLPSGLRDLSLCGIKLKGEEDWTRSLGILARKMIVLRFLDLSNAPYRMHRTSLSTLLIPSTCKLPSLKVLGMRNNVATAKDKGDVMQAVREHRHKWVEVVWE